MSGIQNFPSRAVVDDLCRSRSSRHETRSAISSFERHNLSFRVKISNVKAASVTKHPVLRVRHFVQALFRAGEEGLLFGARGKSLDSHASALLDFWRDFKKTRPSHPIFSVHPSDDELACCLPVHLHGDEGRGLKKRSVAVFSWMPTLGVGTRKTQEMDLSDLNEINYCGNTLQTRFLWSVAPTSLYAKKTEVFDALLSELAEEFRDIFFNGIQWFSKKIVLVVISSKGDWQWHCKSAKLTRTFNHLCATSSSLANPKKKKPSGICHLCLGGQDGVPWEDPSITSKWAQTIGTSSLPWHSAPPFTNIPQDEKHLAEFYAIDAFHTLQKGVEADAVASVLIVLFNMLWPEATSVDAKLARSWNSFVEWCRSQRLTPHLQHFSRELLGWAKEGVYPTASWFKGADTRLLSKWLECLLSSQKANLRPDDCFFAGIMYEMMRSINQFHRILQSSPIWVPGPQARECVLAGESFLRSYSRSAQLSFDRSLTRFPLRPKYHMFGHLVERMSRELAAGLPVWNCLSDACPLDEDFIGKVCRLSRRVSNALTSQRTLELYLIELGNHLQ